MEISAKKYPVEKAKGKSTKYNKLQVINLFLIYCDYDIDFLVNIKRIGLKFRSLNNEEKEIIKKLYESVYSNRSLIYKFVNSRKQKNQRLTSRKPLIISMSGKRDSNP